MPCRTSSRTSCRDNRTSAGHCRTFRPDSRTLALLCGSSALDGPLLLVSSSIVEFLDRVVEVPRNGVHLLFRLISEFFDLIAFARGKASYLGLVHLHFALTSVELVLVIERAVSGYAGRCHWLRAVGVGTGWQHDCRNCQHLNKRSHLLSQVVPSSGTYALACSTEATASVEVPIQDHRNSDRPVIIPTDSGMRGGRGFKSLI